MSFQELKKWHWVCDNCGVIEITENISIVRPDKWKLGKMENPMSMFEKDKDLCEKCSKGEI